MTRPLDDDGEPPLSLMQLSQPATPDVPSLVFDGVSAHTISPAPFPPQRPVLAHARSATSEPEFRRLTAPSTASSRRKRNRDDDDTSISSPSKLSRLSDSTFASTYKDRLRTEYSGCCCVCGVAHNLHGAHVFDKSAKTEFERARRRGLVSLETLGDFENAIYICAGDHTAFDAVYPQLIIVPTYLDYFIDHEKRWQEHITITKNARVPVTSSSYAAHCSAQRGETLAYGLYIAYPVVDYKNKDNVGAPREFQWHGDPGAVIWKANPLIGAELTLRPRPAHLQELKHVREQLHKLRNLREDGDEQLADAFLSSLSTSNQPPQPPPGDAGSAPPQAAPADAPPPPPLPPPPSSHPDVAHPAGSYPSLPTTSHSGINPRPGLTASDVKRKRALSEVVDEELDDQAVCVPTVEQPQPKRMKATPVPTTILPHQEDWYPSRWGGPGRSTEETVRYWNAIFEVFRSNTPKPP